MARLDELCYSFVLMSSLLMEISSESQHQQAGESLQRLSTVRSAPWKSVIH